MPALTAKLAVAVAAVVVAWAGIEAVRLRPVATTAPSRTAAEAGSNRSNEVPRLAPGVVKKSEPKESPTDTFGPLGIAAMARIHGRVLGNERGDSLPEISAEDSSHGYEAEVEADGRFEINLPAGSYTLIATMDDLVATAEVAGLDHDEDREITLVLGKGAAIQGTVHGPDGTEHAFAIQVHRTGRPQRSFEAENEENGQFTADGLIPGRGYDLTVTAPKMRRLVLKNVIGPKRGLDITLEPTATLRGGFGVAAERECPMETVGLVAAADDNERDSAVFNRACQFELDDLPDVPSVHIAAEGSGWHFEAEVTLPKHGDPPFLCLHEPCRDTGPEPKATLAVTLHGARGRDWSYSADDGTRFRGASCRAAENPCPMDDLSSGRRVRVHVNADNSKCENQTIDLVPGLNTLTVVCEVERTIQGVVRTVPGREGAEPKVGLRCSAGYRVQVVPGRIFQMECPVRLSSIEYQLSPDGPWLTAPIRSNGPEDAGFVEIP